MAQKVTGFRAIFSSALIYNLAQRMVGAEKARHILVQDYFPAQNRYRMLDIGCGTAEILRHLPTAIDYHGFDASEAYIQQAVRLFGNRGTFRAELVREATLDELGSFDLILAFGLLHHLGDDEAGMLFQLASHALAPGGKLLTIDPTYVAGQNSMAKWIISKDRGQCIRSPEHYSSLASQQFARVNTMIRHDMLRIPYSHCILECQNSAPQTL
ncbi:class I SAM-dependent methyltransferase [Mariprofundus erugo]|uniref:class I SAM-dependent methyltransferase n=1 Tax=Mariprofundus erugo TaxID=2528639 RepID=UPI0010FE2665|nr:class I SAM-dependent methyltransferase [Mariprofundus erugo]TLS74921.1 class I SAM-dependent methyltransferase [Mariprofundus erugo]